jgi:hypothetical protein
MTLRRILIISGIAVGVLVLIAGALTAYAFFNLSSIVARNEKRIVARVSNELGRRVKVGKIQAQMGWGVSVEVSGLTIADDSSFSAKPWGRRQARPLDTRSPCGAVALLAILTCLYSAATSTTTIMSRTVTVPMNKDA